MKPEQEGGEASVKSDSDSQNLNLDQPTSTPSSQSRVQQSQESNKFSTSDPTVSGGPPSVLDEPSIASSGSLGVPEEVKGGEEVKPSDENGQQTPMQDPPTQSSTSQAQHETKNGVSPMGIQQQQPGAHRGRRLRNQNFLW